MAILKKKDAMDFAQFMATPEGRGLRIAAGTALIAGGLSRGTWTGALVAVLGIVPLLAGALNICVLAPILDVPADGDSLQA